MARVTLSVFVVIALAGCSQSPTAPSRSTAAPPDGALSSWALEAQAARALPVDWQCFNNPAGCGAAVIGAGFSPDTADSPTNLRATIDGTTVILSWNAPAGGPILSYVIEAGTAPGLSNITAFDTNNIGTTLTVANVPPGTYHVRVRRRSDAGLSGPSSDVIVNVGNPPPPGPCPPSPPSGLSGSASGSTVSLAWNGVTGAVAYVVEAGSTPGASNLANFDTGSASPSLSATAPAGTYYVRVRARSSCGTSAPSNEVIVTVGGPPPPAAGLTGRWIGLVANGDGLRSSYACDERWDWQLDLTQTGNVVTGTFIQTDVMKCPGDGPLRTQTRPLLNGTVNGNSFTFSVQTVAAQDRLHVTGTIAGNRITGTTVHTRSGETGTFAVNKQ